MKKIMKRMGVLLLAAAVVFSFTPLLGGLAGGSGGGPEVYAAEDTTAPVIDLSTLKASPDYAFKGDSVKVSVKITDNQGVKESHIWVMQPNGNTEEYSAVPMTYNSSTGKWEFTLSVANKTTQGTWVVWQIDAIDTNNLKTVAGGSVDKTLTKFNVNVVKAITPTVKLSPASYTFDGSAKKPDVTVKDGSTVLPASQYSVTFADGRVNVGKYSIKVELRKNYSGSKTVYFKINPKGTSLKSVTKASKAFTAKWTKQSEKMATARITGYQIKLATNSKFTKNTRTVTVKGYSKTSKKVTKLKGGKKYYVKIRTYKTINGTKYYSKWSKYKTVTTKK